MLIWVPCRHCWEISHSNGQLFYKPKCQVLVLDFSNKFRKSQIFVKLRFVLNLKWFNQDAFMDSATSHFRPQFWSWSCGCGQQELESHWYQLSWSCRRQACAQRKRERRKLAEQSSDALRDSPTTSNGAESNQKYPLPPLCQMEVRWTISFKVMCTANSISDFLKLATAGIRWGPSCKVKLYEHFLVTRLGVVRSHPSSWKCNTLCRNTKSPYGFKGGGIFYKCLSSEIRGGIRISVLAWRKSVTSKWQKNNFKSESLKPAHQKTKQNKLLFFFFFQSGQFHNCLSYMPWQSCNSVYPWVCSSWVQLQPSSWGHIPWPDAWPCWCRGCRDPDPWLLEEVSQPELLQPTVRGLPKTRRCIEPSLMQKHKCWRLVLISHLWITSGFHHAIRPLRDMLDLMGLSAIRKFGTLLPWTRRLWQ